MSALAYRPDMDAVRQRLTTWWNGGDIGRPAMLISFRRDAPRETVPEKPLTPTPRNTRPGGIRFPISRPWPYWATRRQ